MVSEDSLGYIARFQLKTTNKARKKKKKPRHWQSRKGNDRNIRKHGSLRLTALSDVTNHTITDLWGL